MAKGMKLPVKVNKKGGATLIDATPYTDQTVRAALTPNISKNPFQAGGGIEIGISERFIFAINSPGAQAGARRQITNVFKRLRAQEIAKLASGRDGLKFTADGPELIAEINYVELEADQERHLSSNLKDALQSEPKVNSSGQ
jgi:hypothetical protein